MGDPPQQKQAAKERATRERIEFDAEGALENLGQRLSKIKLPEPKVLGVVAAVLLLVGGLAWILSRESVQKRSELLVSAISKGDMDMAMGLALPGTEGDAMKWLFDTHKQYLDLKLALGGQDPVARISVQEAGGGNSAQTLLTFSRESTSRLGPLVSEELDAVPRNKPTKLSMEMVIFWTPDTWGNWRFDAKRTAEVINARP
jgi:hypothetical protein